MKKLFVSDLDDTLVENGKQIPEHNINVLNRIFQDNEKELMIASARNYDNIIRRIKGLEKSIKIIARNGSIIYNENGTIKFFFKIREEKIKRIIKYSLDNNLCPVIVSIIDNNEIFYTYKKYLNDEILKHKIRFDFKYIENLENEIFENVIGIYAFGKIKKEKKYELLGVKVIKDLDFIHFVGKHVDKGYALKKINRIYKYKNITCFGNDENDYSMLDYCDNPYFVFKDNKSNKYDNLPFDNGVSILKVMEKN